MLDFWQIVAIALVIGICIFAGVVLIWGFIDWFKELDNTNKEGAEAEEQKLDDYEKKESELQSSKKTNQTTNVFINGDNNTVNINSPGTNKVRPTNCVNCGAPLHGDKCPFCDTEYR